MGKKLLSLEPEKYILKCDRELPENERTVFLIRPLTFAERAEVQDAAITTEVDWAGPKTQKTTATMRHHGGQQGKMAIVRGLIEIQNLVDKENKPIPFNDSVSQEFKTKVLNQIMPEYLNEIGARILVISGLQKEEEKN